MGSVLQLFPLLVFIGLSNLYSQILPFKNYTIKDGLVSNNVSALYQDSKGYLWVGTTDGISVYDGYAFRNLRYANGMPNNSVRCITESRSKPRVMWFGTGRGVCKYINGSFESISISNIPAANNVNVLIEDHHGVLWVGVDHGIYRIEHDSVFQFALNTPSYSIESIIELNDSTIVFGGNAGLFVYQRNTDTFRQFYKYDPEFGVNRQTFMTREKDSTLLVVAQYGILLKVRDTVVIRQYHADYIESYFVVRDGDFDFWMGAINGLYKLTIDVNHHLSAKYYNSNNGLRGNKVNAGLLDRENNLWLGVYGKGLMRLTAKNQYRFPSNLYDWAINDYSAAVDRDGHFWVIKDSGLSEIWKDQNGEWKRFTHFLGGKLGNRQFRSTITDSLQNLWLMSTDGRLECYRIIHSPKGPSSLQIIHDFRPGIDFPNSSSLTQSACPTKMIVDHHGLLWIDQNFVGVAVLDPRRQKPLLKLYTTEDGLPQTTVHAICEDDKGNIWFGGYDWGIIILEGGYYGSGAITHLTTANGLPDNYVRTIKRDHTGRIWVGTIMGGVAIIKDTTVRTLSISDGLPSNSIRSIKEDYHGNIWLGSSGGLARVRQNDDFKIEVVESMLGEMIVSVVIGNDGTVCAVSFDAVDILELPEQVHRGYAPPIYITALNVDGQSYAFSGKQEFSYRQNYLMIEFLGISFTHERELKYQYKLASLDTNWHEAMDERRVILAALGAGDYEFIVRAVTPDGTTSTNPAILYFTIHPPFYQRWWFVGMIFILFALSTYSFVRHRIRKVHRDRQVQREFSRRLIDSQEQERKRIAAELHDSIGQELLIIKNRALLGLEACPEDTPTKKELEKISNISSQSIGAIREISYNLRPYQLDRLGLTKAIQSIITRVEGSSHVRFESSIAQVDNLFPKEYEINIYRIIQEGINNALKHAQASIINIKVEDEKGTVTIYIADNGKGFDAGKTLSSIETQGFGLRGIAERVRIVGGKFSITSSINGGTTLLITVQY